MKILLTEDARGYADAVANFTTKASLVQAALTAYLALGLAAVPTTADLPDLWQRPETFLERMITGGQPVTIGGSLALAPGQLFNLLAKPAGWENFLAVVSGLRLGQPKTDVASMPDFGGSDIKRATYLATLKNPDNWSAPGVDISQYELNGGTVQVRQAVLAATLESYRTYATSQRQKDEWDSLQTIVGALESIRQNGRFGAVFEVAEYMKKALVNQGYMYSGNPIKVDAAYVTQL